MMITKPSRVKKLPNFPRKSTSFFNGYRFESKYFSTNYSKELDSLRQEYPASKSCELISFQMKLYSNSFSLDYFANDLIRVHDMVLRTVFVSMRMLPVGYHLFFDTRAKSIKAQFFLVNYNRMADEKSLNGELSKSEYKTLVSKIKEKVGNHSTVSFEPQDDAESNDVVRKVNESGDSESVNEIAFSFANMLTDSDQRKAFERALKGLPINKAQQMLSTINALIELNGDASVPKLTLPKKVAGGQARSPQVKHINKRETENLNAFLALQEYL